MNFYKSYATWGADPGFLWGPGGAPQHISAAGKKAQDGSGGGQLPTLQNPPQFLHYKGPLQRKAEDHFFQIVGEKTNVPTKNMDILTIQK